MQPTIANIFVSVSSPFAHLCKQWCVELPGGKRLKLGCLSPMDHLISISRFLGKELLLTGQKSGIIRASPKTPGHMPEGDAGLGPPSSVERRLVKLFPGRRSRGTRLPPGPSTQTRVDTARAVFGKIVRFKHPLEGSGE